MPEPHLILASSSPRRIDLLREFRVTFEVVPSTAEELHDERLPATELCMTNALRKAGQVAEAHPEAVILGADTLVTLRGRHFGKPRDLAHAAQMLADLSGKTHQVVTGVALLHLAQDRQESFAVETQVTFRRLAPAEIQEYMRLVPVLDKAGSYAVQDRGELIVERIDGSLTNVIGLPVERLAERLCAWHLLTPHARDRIVASQRSWNPRT
jgi:septum formation protein